MKPKTKTVQLFEDEVYWASIVATFRKSTIARVLSPLIRGEIRRMLNEHGVDPDEAFAKLRCQPEDKP